MLRANILKKYEVEYGNDFNAMKFLECVENYTDTYEEEEECDELVYCQPEYWCGSGLYEFNRAKFNDFVKWADENVEDESLKEFIHDLQQSNPNDLDYVRVEIW